MQAPNPTADEPVRTEILGAVGVITLDRPQRFNSLDVRTAQDLRRAGLRMARDPAVRAIVLRGRPGVFCSGVDLRYVRDGGRVEDLAYLTPDAATEGRGAIFKQVLEYVNGAIIEIRRAPKPVLAAVDGIAAAGGLGLALCCDLVLASERAVFEWAYGRTGLSGAESVTFLLPRLVGLRGALDLAWLSPRLDAHAARARGLVSEVLATDGFEAAVLEVAERLADGPADAYARTKRLLNRAAGMEALEAHLSAEVEALVESADSAEFTAGLERFFARKRPHGAEE
ncbi:enoyl-CoA hydratase/isomerase family protein [Myxococcota bacterium]|nr:enoyl-CoA hydratase/isomerase family protein [Myxococcota bacterium]